MNIHLLCMVYILVSRPLLLYGNISHIAVEGKEGKGMKEDERGISAPVSVALQLTRANL